MTITLKNNLLTVQINTLGAEITSLKTSDGAERIHQPEAIWENQAPVLFPVCGAPAEGKIVIDGNDYPMAPHGFAMTSEFDVAEISDAAVLFSLKSNAETKKSYPYDFELLVGYTLNESSIDVCYKVINKSKNKMYFSIGSHEGYICPEGLSKYELHFEKSESQKPHVYETGLTPEENLKEVDGHSVLVLTDDLFNDSVTIVYENTDSDYVILKNTESNAQIKVDYKGTENLFVWTEPGCKFVCIEPWCGLADYGKTHTDISNKAGIHCISPEEIFERHHIITFS